MTFLVFGFVTFALLLAAAGLMVIHLALRTSPKERDDIARILGGWNTSAREDLTGEIPRVGPVSHRSDLVAPYNPAYLPRHHTHDMEALVRTILTPTEAEAFNLLIATVTVDEFGTVRELVAA